MPEVSVIIPTYHDWDRLLLCVKALEKQNYPKEKFEVLIINNDPNDSKPEGFDIPENFYLIDEEKKGSYAARNTGIRIAKGDILAFTDSDCIPDENWLCSAVNIMNANPGIDRIGGRVELFISRDKPNLAEAYELVYAFRQEEVTERGVAVTANLIVRKAVFNSVGLFNQEMYSGGDTEWGQRAFAKGFNIVYSSETTVKHPARNSLKLLTKKAQRVASGAKFFKDVSLNIKLKKLVHLLIFPPYKEKKYIASRLQGAKLSLVFSVFFLRYYILLIRAIENIKLHFGTRIVEDKNL